MIEKLKAWFAPPKLTGNDDQDRRASLMNMILMTGLSVIILVTLSNLFDPATPLRYYFIDLIKIATCLGLRAAVRRGKLNLAGSGILLGGYLFSIVATTSQGTLSGTAITYFVILVIMAGLLFKRNGIFISTLVSSLTCLGLAWAEKAGLLPAPYTPAPLLTWFVITLLLGMAGGLTIFAYSTTQQALERAQNELRERQRAEQALAESRIRLEAVVDSTADLVWAVEPATFGLISFNKSMRDYFMASRGLTLLEGSRPAELNDPNFTQVWEGFYRRALREGPYTTEYEEPGGSLILELSFNLLKRAGQVFGIAVFGEDITERRHTERALAESSSALDAIFQSTTDLIWAVDPLNFGLISYNASLDEFFRHYRQIAARPGLRSADLNDDPRYAKVWTDLYQRALREGAFTTEFQYFDTPVTLGLTFNLLKRAGQVFGISVFGKDISQRRRAEIDLRESKLRLELALKAGSAGWFEWDIASGQEIINAGYAEMLGYTLKELMPFTYQDWQALCHTDDLQANLREVQRHLRGESAAFRVETRLKHKNGSWVWVLSSGQVTERDASGQPLRVTGTHIDLSARKQIEAALREKEELFRSFIQQSPLGQAVMDEDGKCLEWNPAIEQVTGIPAVEAIGMNTWDIQFQLLAPEQRTAERRAQLKAVQPKLVEFMKTTHRAVSPQNLDARIMSRDGEIKVLRQVGFPIETSTGFRFGVSFLDVTRQKEEEFILEKRLELMEYAASHTLKEIIRKALDEIETLSSSRISFLHLLDENSQTIELSGYSSRTEDEYCKLNQALWLHRPLFLAGVWADSIRQAQPIIHNDYAALEKKKGLPDGHSALLREMVIPILRGGRVVAALGIGNKPSEYSQADLQAAARFADYVYDIVENKRAGTEIQNLLKIIENAQDMVGSALPNGRLSYLNPAGRRMLGIPPGAPISEYNIKNFVPTDSLEFIFRDIFSQAAQHGHWSGETIMISSGGQRYNVLQSVVAHHDASGQVSHYSTIGSDISALKQAEQAVHANEALYHAMFNSTSAVKLLIDPASGAILRVNQAAIDFYGYTLEELERMNISQLNTLPDAEIKKEMQDALAERRNYFNFRHRLASGEVRDVEVYSGPLEVDGQRLLHSIVHDVTARRQAERIQRARTRLLEISQNKNLAELLTATLDETETLTGSRIGFYHFVDADQVTLSLQSWSTRTQAEYCTASIADKHYSIDKAGVWADAARLRQPVIHNDYDALPADQRKGLPAGHAALVRELVVPVLRGSKVVCILGVGNKETAYNAEDLQAVAQMADLAWDVTELKQAEQALRQSEENMRAILNSSPEAAFLINVEGMILAANQAIARKTGLDPAALIGANAFSSLPPELAASRKNKFDEVIRSGQPIYFEDQDGEYWFATNVYPVLGADGQVTSLAIYNRDISEAINAQAELDHYHNHLEELVAERTVQLEEARAQADAANRAKSEFLAVMSHEIRTPMNGVLGLAHLALQTGLSEKQRNYITHIQESGETLLSIINDILDFSKIEAGKLEIEAIHFDLDDVLHSLANMVAYRAQEKGLELVFNTAPNVPRLLIGDPGRLRQILLNLVGNAIKFTERGEVVVRITVLKTHYNDLLLEFAVRDTGIGMGPEQLERLFESFNQADRSISRKYGGSGLGLVICKRLIGLLGGEISVESQPGQGSTFKFALPFSLQPKARAQVQAVTPDLRGLRVLAVDDHPETLGFIKSILTSLTFKAKTVLSAREALALLLFDQPGKQRFDLLVLDESLADNIDGLQVIRELRQDPELQNLPVILLLPNKDSNQEEFLAAGANSVLVKPITSSSLFDAIMQVFGRSNQPQTWRTKPAATPLLLDDLKGRRLLLVEDDLTNQMVAKGLLEGAGLSLDVANDGEEGVKLALQGGYEALLMDIQMPGIDGFEATRQIRTAGADFGPEKLPIIAMTAHALEGDREKILEGGFNDYVAKPIDVNLLFKALTKWLGAPEGAASAPVARRGRLTSEQHQEREELLDRPGALARLGNNQALYTRLLSEVYKNHVQTPESIGTAITDRDIPRAHRLAHTLKGVAGQIGATGLREACLQLEVALANQEETQYAVLLAQLQQAMAALLPVLKAANRE